jgi:hypothetical protein
MMENFQSSSHVFNKYSVCVCVCVCVCARARAFKCYSNFCAFIFKCLYKLYLNNRWHIYELYMDLDNAIFEPLFNQTCNFRQRSKRASQKINMQSIHWYLFKQSTE